jgi:cytochrome c oxidase subunit 2
VWRLVAAATAVAVATSGCDLPNFGAPDPQSEQGERIFDLWQGFFLAGLAVAALVYGLLVFVIVRYRRRSDDEALPSQSAYHIPLEVVYTVAPVLIVAVLFAASVLTERDVNDLGDDPAAVVDVIGFQWSWQFHYPDERVTITGVPGEGPELVLPVGKPAHLRLLSADVNHSFWVPDFLSKRDLIPGVDNEIEITPKRTGSYVGRCAEFCGLDHWRMNYSVRVVSEAEYQVWLDEQRAAQQDRPELKVEVDEDGDVSVAGRGS